MIHHRFDTLWNFHHVRVVGACSLRELVEYGMHLRDRPGPQGNLDLPALFDLREIELPNDTTDDIKAAIRLRKSLKPETGQNPCAYVMRSPGSFGIMRMYGTYAEIAGLRTQTLTLVTLDLDEAIEWLIGHMDLRGADADQVRALLRHPPKFSG